MNKSVYLATICREMLSLCKLLGSGKEGKVIEYNRKRMGYRYKLAVTYNPNGNVK